MAAPAAEYGAFPEGVYWQQQDYWGQPEDEQQYPPDPYNYEAYWGGYPEGYEEYPAQEPVKRTKNIKGLWRWLLCFSGLIMALSSIAVAALILRAPGPDETAPTALDEDSATGNETTRAEQNQSSSAIVPGASTQPSRMDANMGKLAALRGAPTPASFHPGHSSANEEAPMRRFPLICVFGPSTNLSVVFPEDGLCEFTFYEGVYGPGQEGLDSVRRSGSREEAATMARFLSEASSHSTTQYGLSFHYGGRREALSDLHHKQGRARLSELWKSRIHHYGFLDIDFASFDVPEFRVALTCLSVLHPVLQQLRRDRSDAAYLGIGFYATASMHGQVLQVLRSIYMPSFIIAHGHMSSDDRRLAALCRIMPPTIPDGTGPYEISQAKALDMLEKLNHDAPVLAVSVAMFGRRYKPLNESAFEPGDQCTDYRGSHLVPYTELCQGGASEQSLVRDIPLRTTFVHDARGPWTVTFDSGTDIIEKLCEAKGRHIDLKYGVAVYGTEYSEYTGDCPVFSTRGVYSRLRAVKKVRDFLETNFSSTTQLAPCKEVSFREWLENLE